MFSAPLWLILLLLLSILLFWSQEFPKQIHVPQQTFMLSSRELVFHSLSKTSLIKTMVKMIYTFFKHFQSWQISIFSFLYFSKLQASDQSSSWGTNIQTKAVGEYSGQFPRKMISEKYLGWDLIQCHGGFQFLHLGGGSLKPNYPFIQKSLGHFFLRKYHGFAHSLDVKAYECLYQYIVYY